MEDSLDLPLRKPVSIGDVTYSELKLSEPTVGELVASSKAGNAMEQAAMLIHLNSKLPKRAIDQLSQRDFQDAADFLAHFGDASPIATGT